MEALIRVVDSFTKSSPSSVFESAQRPRGTSRQIEVPRTLRVVFTKITEPLMANVGAERDRLGPLGGSDEISEAEGRRLPESMTARLGPPEREQEDRNRDGAEICTLVSKLGDA